MRFDDCASIVHERRGTGDDAMDFLNKRIFARIFMILFCDKIISNIIRMISENIYHG